MKLIKNTILLIIIVLVTSCKTETKETYLSDYQKFMTEVTDNHQEYSDKDWEKKTKEFDKYKTVLKEKYKNELSWQEQLTLGQHEMGFGLLQLKKESPNLLDLFKGDFEGLKKQIENYTKNEMGDDVDKLKIEIEKARKQLKHYTENNMKGDIEKLKKEAKEMGKDFDEMGKEVEKALEELFKELDIEVDSKKK